MHWLFILFLSFYAWQSSTSLHASLLPDEGKTPETTLFLSGKGVQTISFTLTTYYLEITTVRTALTVPGDTSAVEKHQVENTIFFPRDEISHLTKLLLPRNALQSIPLTILQLECLRHLHLEGNQLNTLPSLASLKYLQSLDVSANRLDTLPILPLSLTWLHAHHNALESWPPIEHLQNLRELDLTYNKIKSMGTLTHHPHLIRLALGDNSFNKLSSLAGLDELSTLELMRLGADEPNSLESLAAFLEMPHTKHVHLKLTEKQYQGIMEMLSPKARAALASPALYTIWRLKADNAIE